MNSALLASRRMLDHPWRNFRGCVLVNRVTLADGVQSADRCK
jgi:hypothetical protein